MAATILFFRRDPEPIEAPPAVESVGALEPSVVERVEVTERGGESFRLTRHGDTWVLEGVAIPTERETIEAAIRRLAPGSGDPADRAPQRPVDLEVRLWSGPRVVELEIWDFTERDLASEEADERIREVLEGDAEVGFRVRTAFEARPYDLGGEDLEPFRRGSGGFLARDLGPDPSAVEEIEIRPEGSEEDGLRLVRRPDGFWLERPIEELARQERVARLLEAFGELEVVSYLAPELVAHAVEPEMTVIVTVTGRSTPLRLDLFDREIGEALLARIDDRVDALVPLSWGELLELDELEFRSTRWTEVDVDAVTAIRLRQGDEPLVGARRVGDDWSVGGHRAGLELPLQVVLGFDASSGDLWTRSKIEQWADRYESSTLATLELELAEGERVELRLDRQVRIEGGTGEPTFVAMNSRRETVLLLEEEDVDDLFEALQGLASVLVPWDEDSDG